MIREILLGAFCAEEILISCLCGQSSLISDVRVLYVTLWSTHILFLTQTFRGIFFSHLLSSHGSHHQKYLRYFWESWLLSKHKNAFETAIINIWIWTMDQIMCNVKEVELSSDFTFIPSALRSFTAPSAQCFNCPAQNVTVLVRSHSSYCVFDQIQPTLTPKSSNIGAWSVTSGVSSPFTPAWYVARHPTASGETQRDNNVR